MVIGDVHGAYDELRDLLFAEGIINEKGEWNVKKTIVVQVGDLIDRGRQNEQVLDFFIHLDETKNDGGKGNLLFLLRG